LAPSCLEKLFEKLVGTTQMSCQQNNALQQKIFAQK
jgi:hypothetical protein